MRILYGRTKRLVHHFRKKKAVVVRCFASSIKHIFANSILVNCSVSYVRTKAGMLYVAIYKLKKYISDM